ncbi:MAG: arginine--tRNA ligase, partial [Patescibacteria group bacterium]
MTSMLSELRSSVEAVLGSDYPITLDVPAEKPGWLAIPVFAAARRLGLSPQDHAHQVAEKLAVVPTISVTVEGGFVNIQPRAEACLRVLTEAQMPTYGHSSAGNGQTVVIEFSGVNIAKPMGIGHLRSTIIGDSLQRIYRALGYTVHAVNHLGDWGTQFGNLVAAYQRKYGDLVVRTELTVDDLLALYVDFHSKVEHDPELKVEGQAMFRRLESGDVEVRALWQSFVNLSLIQFEALYRRLGITFDDVRAGESRYHPMVAALIEQAERSQVAVESQGALVVPIPGESVPLILRKSDGSTIYATRDLAAITYRVREYHPDQILYVVANEQALHFRHVFAAARLLKLLPDKTRLEHVKFG